MKLFLLALLGLASAFGFAPGAMPMQLQQRQACATQGPQMKALNKPARLAEVRRKYNKNHKSEMRTYIKKARRPLLQLSQPPTPRPPRIAGRGPFCGRGAVISRAPLPQPLYRCYRATPQLMVACEAGEYVTASPLLNKVQSCIDKNVKRRLMHKNTAARKKSQLTFKVKALEPAGGAPPAKAPEPVAA